MFASVTHWLKTSIRISFLLTIAAFSTSTALGQAQSNAADLQGYVRDPSGAVVIGATVTVNNAATGFSRDATTTRRLLPDH